MVLDDEQSRCRSSSDPWPRVCRRNDELLDGYQQALGSEVEDLDWFHALVRYKQGAIAALLIRNARRRGDDPLIDATAALLRSARTLLAAT